MSTTIRRAPSKERAAAARERDRTLLTAAAESLLSSEGWARWVRTRNTFRTYSFRNQLLIATQNPDATRVAGFVAWKTLGRQVRAGEHGIRILAPSIRKAKTDALDDKPHMFFRTVSVFDLSQTEPIEGVEPAPLEPPACEPLTGSSHAHLIEPLIALASTILVPVSVEHIPGAAAGYYSRSEKRIVLSDRLADNALLHTLVHELGHALLHHERQADPALPKLTYAEEEVVIETVAWMVCRTLGLDAKLAVGYIASWGEDGALDQARTCAELIDHLAARIEEACE